VGTFPFTIGLRVQRLFQAEVTLLIRAPPTSLGVLRLGDPKQWLCVRVCVCVCARVCACVRVYVCVARPVGQWDFVEERWETWMR
jgi:hypothetical protein